MNNDQFQAIVQYIKARLLKEDSFQIDSDHFCHLFELSQPFYDELISRLSELSLPPFSMDGNWKTDDGDPTDPIHFLQALNNIQPRI